LQPCRAAIAGTLELGRTGALSTGLIIAVIIVAAVIAFIVFIERAQRRLLIQYPKRQVGNRMFQGDTSHLPLKLNTAGVIPPIFASSLLLLPATHRGLFQYRRSAGWASTLLASLGHGQPPTWRLCGLMIGFFAFFYTAIVFNPKDTADNLKKHGGFIPGIRPGERTAEYIDFVLTRITVIGAMYLVFGLSLTRISNRADWRSVLFRWHVASDRRLGDARHGCADSGTSDCPAV
jgi:preprotein translocase subunit SecY